MPGLVSVWGDACISFAFFLTYRSLQHLTVVQNESEQKEKFVNTGMHFKQTNSQNHRIIESYVLGWKGP